MTTGFAQTKSDHQETNNNQKSWWRRIFSYQGSKELKIESGTEMLVHVTR
jgi:hypothetical protein